MHTPASQPILGEPKGTKKHQKNAKLRGREENNCYNTSKGLKTSQKTKAYHKALNQNKEIRPPPPNVVCTPAQREKLTPEEMHNNTLT